jgi:hypothetical protein
MIRDSIVEEVRRIRQNTEKACGHDWKKLAEHYRKVKPTSGRLIKGKPRRLTRRAATNK